MHSQISFFAGWDSPAAVSMSRPRSWLVTPFSGERDQGSLQKC